MYEIFQWYNWIFVIPAFGILVYIILQLFSSLSDSVGAFMGDVAFEDLGSKSNIHWIFWRFMSFLNFDKIPNMIFIIVFGLSWGISGYTFNKTIINATDSYHPKWFLLSCIFAFTFSVILTKVSSELILFFFPTAEDKTMSTRNLVGKTAKIISGKVTDRFGRARVSLNNMNITIFCKIQTGDNVLKYGDEVILIDFDEKDRFFYVEKFELS